MSDYSASVVNCFMYGDRFQAVGNQKVRNLALMNLGGLDVELHQAPELIDAKWKDHYGSTVRTTKLVIPDLAPDRLAEAKELTDAVCQLLSLARCSEVASDGYEFPGASPPGEQWSTTAQFFKTSEVLEAVPGRISGFVQGAWTQFTQLQEPRKLNVAIGYFLHSNKPAPVEIRIVLTIVMLEHMKHYYAVVDGYPFIKGFFREKTAIPTKPGRFVSFATLLTEMFRSVGMHPNLRSIIDLRNQMLHSGLSPLGLKDEWAMYCEMQMLVREYLLRLLGYSGDFVGPGGNGTI